jgi:hypothetical protein
MFIYFIHYQRAFLDLLYEVIKRSQDTKSIHAFISDHPIFIDVPCKLFEKWPIN